MGASLRWLLAIVFLDPSHSPESAHKKFIDSVLARCRGHQPLPFLPHTRLHERSASIELSANGPYKGGNMFAHRALNRLLHLLFFIPRQCRSNPRAHIRVGDRETVGAEADARHVSVTARVAEFGQLAAQLPIPYPTRTIQPA
jgi:hypothetical protein